MPILSAGSEVQALSVTGTLHRARIARTLDRQVWAGLSSRLR